MASSSDGQEKSMIEKIESMGHCNPLAEARNERKQGKLRNPVKSKSSNTISHMRDPLNTKQ